MHYTTKLQKKDWYITKSGGILCFQHMTLNLGRGIMDFNLIEKAKQLMGAVVYCINEAINQEEYAVAPTKKQDEG